MRVWCSYWKLRCLLQCFRQIQGAGRPILFSFTSNFMQAYADLIGEMRVRSFQEHHPKNANDIKWSIIRPCSFLLDRFPVSVVSLGMGTLGTMAALHKAHPTGNRQIDAPTSRGHCPEKPPELIKVPDRENPWVIHGENETLSFFSFSWEYHRTKWGFPAHAWIPEGSKWLVTLANKPSIRGL